MIQIHDSVWRLGTKEREIDFQNPCQSHENVSAWNEQFFIEK